MRRVLWLIGAIATLGAGVAHGKECKGAAFSEQTQVGGTTLVLNGLGLHQATMLNIDAYVAALYLAKASGDPQAILEANSAYVLTLQLLRNVSARDISKGWNEGFDRNAKGQLGALKNRITTLNGWMADMKAGQRMSFSFKPGAGLEVNVNGTARGTIEGDDFGKAFLSISLGVQPDRDLKAGLLGSACH